MTSAFQDALAADDPCVPADEVPGAREGANLDQPQPKLGPYPAQPQPGLCPDLPGPPLLLLDLPTVLLLEVLRDAPLHLRATCRAFRDLLNDARHRLRLARGRWPSHLSSLLHRLPRLRHLDASGQDVRTLPYLAACPHLHSLNLSDSAVTAHQLHAVAACPSLTLLDLSRCTRLVDLDALAALPALRSLHLVGCNKLPRITPVASLTALRTLDLRHCLASLSPLQHCPLLTSLTLTCGWDRALDLGVLTALHALRSLVIHHDASLINLFNLPDTRWDLLDLSPLAACAALTLLDVDGRAAQAHDLAPLSHCSRLATLRLECSAAVSSLAPLAACGVSLTHLFLLADQVQDLQPLAACTRLASLELLTAQVTDLSPLLRASTRLASLCLGGCAALEDLVPLAARAPSLVTLSLFGCAKVSSVSPLLACTALRHLDLTYTGVRQVLPLITLASLVLLRVEADRIPAEEVDKLRAACGPRILEELSIPAGRLSKQAAQVQMSQFLQDARDSDLSAGHLKDAA